MATKVEVRDEEGRGMTMWQYDGLLVPEAWKDPVIKLQEIKELECRKDDIFLCSYPKTGSHWTTNLVRLLLRDSSTPVKSEELLIDGNETARLDACPSPRILTSHLQYDRLPRQHIEQRGKTIVIARNVKDTAVSMYHFNRKASFLGSTSNWEHFLDCFAKGQVMYGSYFDYYNSWDRVVKSETDHNIHVVHFEALKKDACTELRKICQYLEIERTDKVIEEIVTTCDFGRMKKFHTDDPVFSFLLDDNGQHVIYRKGEVGDWKNTFTVAQNEAMDALIEQELALNSLLHTTQENASGNC